MANAINKFPVPLIFKKIFKDQMSGELIVSHDGSTRRLFFVNGRLEFATTTLENEHLGDVLLEEGKINREQLRLALDIRSNIPTKIGEILGKTCDLTMRDIYDALMKQVIKIASATFPLKEGEWRFIKKNPDIPNPQKLKVKLPEVIREGVKKLDDVSYYKKRFYFRSPVTLELPDTVSKILTREETDIFEELSRFTNISVKNIIPRLRVPESIFWRIIILFYLLNVLDFVEFTVDDEEKNEKIAEINEMYQKIKSGQSDYFQLLESDKIKTVKEVSDHFSDVFEKFNPDKLNVAPDSTDMKRAREVFAEIQQAHDAVLQDIENKNGNQNENADVEAVDMESEQPLELSIEDKIEQPPEIVVDMESEQPLELDKSSKINPPPDTGLQWESEQPPEIVVDMESEQPLELDNDDKIQQPPEISRDREGEKPPEMAVEKETEQPAKPEASKADQVKQAREFFTKANHLHNQKKYFEASSLLQKAVAMDNSKANYFLLLGLCQSKMQTTKKLAEKNLKKAAQMEPWNADPIFALGQLYKSENLMKKAKAYYEKALEINMEHTLAGKAISEFGGLFGDKKFKLPIFGKKK